MSTSQAKEVTKEAKELQAKTIRARLRKKYQEISENVSLYKVHEQVSEYFPVAYGTVKNVLDESNADDPSTPNLYVVLALCRLWHLDTAYIFSPPESTVEVMPTPEAIIDSEKYVMLTDHHYLGTFYGYFNVPNSENRDYAQFELQMEMVDGKTHAKFTYIGSPKDENGKAIDYTRVYHGTPILQTRTKNVFLLLTNDNGGMFFMYFTYKEYNAQFNYFRKGIIVTSETVADHPVVESFVFFRNPIKKEKRDKYLRGLLPMSDDTFYISVPIMERLVAEDDEVSAFFAEYGYLIQHEEDHVYPISVSEIMAKIKRKDRDKQYAAIRALLLIKQKSLSPARLVYEHNITLAHFTKDDLQR